MSTKTVGPRPAPGPVIVAVCRRCGDALRREDARVRGPDGYLHARCTVQRGWVRTCRVCRCTDAAEHLTDAGPCWWIEHDRCSACAPTPAERAAQLEGQWATT
jgi:hypothetical protein